MKILIADDEELIRFTLKDMIKEITAKIDLPFLSIQEVANGNQLIQKFRKEHPDLVFADIRMPGCTGLEAMEKLKQEKGMWIFLTGHAEFEYAHRALKLGAMDYLLKPPSPAELEKVLSKAWKNLKTTDMKVEKSDITTHSSLNSPIVEKVIKIILTRFSEDIGIAQIADELDVTPNYLSSLFRKKTGCLFTNYLTSVRMEHAKNLLKTTDLNIKEISSRSGYSSSRHFSTVFRKEYGLSPSKYIAKFRGNP